MKAFALIDFESGPALRDLPIPEPGSGEVRVRVKAAALRSVKSRRDPIGARDVLESSRAVPAAAFTLWDPQSLAGEVALRVLPQLWRSSPCLNLLE